MSAASSPRQRLCLIPLDKIADKPEWKRPGGNDAEHVEDLRDALRSGQELPRILVWKVAGEYLIADGEHRRAAYAAEGKKAIPCVLRAGTMSDFRLAWAAANRNQNSLKRDRAYMRQQVRAALTARPDATSRAIAKHCNVSGWLVDAVRREMESAGEIAETPTVVSESGRKYQRSQTTAVNTPKPDKAPTPRPRPPLSTRSLMGKNRPAFEDYASFVGSLRRQLDKLLAQYPQAKHTAESAVIDRCLAEMLEAIRRLAKKFPDATHGTDSHS